MIGQTERSIGREWRGPLRELLGERPRRLELLHQGLRAQVLRCHLSDGKTVIVKASATLTPTARREGEALRFLTKGGASLAPALLARAKDRRLVVMEELAGEPLAGLLAREQVAGARGPLVAIARALGGFHGEQAARVEALPRALRGEYLQQAEDCVGLRERVGAVLERAGVTPARGFDAAWRALTERMGAPGDFLTLTHGDLAPSNVLLTERGPRLLDFEFSGARSALYDVMFWEFVVPFPRVLAGAMTRAYRAALARWLPAARDEARFRRELATLKTHRFYWWLTFRLGEALVRDDAHWVPGWRLRSAYLFYLQSYLTSSRGLAGDGPLSRTARRLHLRLRDQWKDRAGYPEGFLSPRGSGATGP
ncbi:aminoglycoside phosphotransferase family protein [Myxococcus sp. K38C18041901]|uniref:phosphotransferase family protein n=1 Tax=Myxococcus guangdongensis TaxID=2906760 RepID=UPI0020A77B14|nr:aminoglycoside phosphotransferase family protein [Myxococcus guangdongensis]MCP3059800.1 aminoglycoside phosphotransferase family protein [Myxococcus guangdongensis]